MKYDAVGLVMASLSGLTVTSTASDFYMPRIRMPETDWQHSDERKQVAEEKRLRKQAKRLALTKENQQ